MNWYVYLLVCNDTSIYTGITSDLKRRLKQHNAGSASKYTRSRRPVSMVYFEKISSRSKALKKESQIKKWSRKRKMALYL
jgi:putative endonuclease